MRKRKGKEGKGKEGRCSPLHCVPVSDCVLLRWYTPLTMQQQQRGGACPAVGRDPVAAGSGVSNSNGRREEEGRGKKGKRREREGGDDGEGGECWGHGCPGVLAGTGEDPTSNDSAASPGACAYQCHCQLRLQLFLLGLKSRVCLCTQHQVHQGRRQAFTKHTRTHKHTHTHTSKQTKRKRVNERRI